MLDISKKTFCLFVIAFSSIYELVRKDMDVNEHKRLFNITLRHKFQVKEQWFIAPLHFTVTVGSSTMSKLIP